MRTIAVCNQKGGVGKTTISVLLADAATRAGERVLLVDLDPQANATSATGVARPGQPTLGDVLTDPRGASLDRRDPTRPARLRRRALERRAREQGAQPPYRRRARPAPAPARPLLTATTWC